jgi:hypothetical protein
LAFHGIDLAHIMSLTREQLEAMLVDYVYDDLSPSDRTRFEAEVSQWPAIQAELKDHQRTRTMLSKVEAIEPPIYIAQSLLREARKHVAHEEKAGFFSRLAALFMQPSFAAVAVFCLMAGVASYMSVDARHASEEFTEPESMALSEKPAASMDEDEAVATVSAKKSPALAEPAPALVRAADAPGKVTAAAAAPPIRTAETFGLAGAKGRTSKSKKKPSVAGHPRLRKEVEMARRTSNRKRPTRPKASHVISSKLANWRFEKSAKPSGLSRKTGGRSMARALSGSANKDSKTLGRSAATPAAKPMPSSSGAAADKADGAARKQAIHPKRLDTDPKRLFARYQKEFKSGRYALAKRILARLEAHPAWRKRAKKERRLLVQAEVRQRLARKARAKRRGKSKPMPASRPQVQGYKKGKSGK